MTFFEFILVGFGFSLMVAFLGYVYLMVTKQELKVDLKPKDGE